VQANWRDAEQKRRHAIREGFDRLSNLVPGLDGQARSEGVVLHGTVDYVKQLMLERRAMIQALEAKGVAVDPDTKK
jgi:septum formation protein